jgi:hypothetical protein
MIKFDKYKNKFRMDKRLKNQMNFVNRKRKQSIKETIDGLILVFYVKNHHAKAGWHVLHDTKLLSGF